MAKRSYFSGPVVRSGACFHADKARFKLSKEGQNLGPAQLARYELPFGGADAMDVEHVFCDVDSDPRDHSLSLLVGQACCNFYDFAPSAARAHFPEAAPVSAAAQGRRWSAPSPAAPRTPPSAAPDPPLIGWVLVSIEQAREAFSHGARLLRFEDRSEP